MSLFTVNPIGIGTVATLPNLGDLSENVQIRVRSTLHSHEHSH